LSLSELIGLTFGDSFLFLAYKKIGARVSMLVMYLSPAFAVILTFFLLKEKLNLISILGIIITITGILLVFYDRNINRPEKINYTGLFFALLASIGQGIGLVLAKIAFLHSDNSLNEFFATSVRLLVSFFILLPTSILMRKLKNPIEVF